MRVSTLFALALVMLASDPGHAAAPPAKVSKQVAEDLGERAVAVLSGATRVEVFRLAKRPAQNPKGLSVGADKLRWPVTATGKEKGKEFAAKVRDLLFDQTTRTLSGASGFRGDVAFRLWKGKESVTVVVDFEGSQFLVVARDNKDKQIKAAVGGFLFDAKGDFDKGGLFARVKALAVEAFPDDKALKAMKKGEVDSVDLLKR